MQGDYAYYTMLQYWDIYISTMAQHHVGIDLSSIVFSQ